MNPDQRIEQRLHQALYREDDEALAKEICDRLEWYRTNLMNARREAISLSREVARQAKVISDYGWRDNPGQGMY